MQQVNWKIISVNLLMVGVSCFLGLLLVEIVLSRLPSPENNDEQKKFFEHDPLLGWRHVANITGEYKTQEYRIAESFNSKGIRGPEYRSAKRKGEYRILVLGDSFAEGYTVNFEELFSEVLKKELQVRQKSQRSIEVINMGVAGYSTDQEYLQFDIEGRNYSPDLTVLMFYENDVWYNAQSHYWRGVKPLFRLKEDDLYLESSPLRPEDALIDELRAQDHVPLSLRNRLKKSNIVQILNRSMERSALLYRIGLLFGIKNFPDELKVWKKGADPEMDYAWDLTQSLIFQLFQEIRMQGGELLVVNVPSSASVDPTIWKETKLKYGLDDEHWDVRLSAQRLSEFCKDNKIPFADPTEFLKQAAQKGADHTSKLYFKHDGHWTPQGHRLIGEFLTQKIDKLIEKRK